MAKEEIKMGRIIGAAAAGTMIEWYDFYLFGALAVLMAGKFFPDGDPTVGFLKTLAVFATGFAVRPLGAVVFGRVGDAVGRKYAFMVTITIMGAATFAMGLLPTYAQAGIFAPIALVALRLLQGLALGGEYGGAAIYVAEHCPDEKRGYYTGFIQTTATLGLLISLVVILVTRRVLGNAAFDDWGWRIPFLLSAFLVAMALYIRWQMRETPLFAKMKAEGKESKNPLADSLGNGKNWKLILLALFGATAGQATVWYTGQFYALYFMQTVLKVPSETASLIVCVALIMGTPLFVVFGALSDRLGRKTVMLAGNALAALTYVPIYMAMKAFAEPLNVVVLTGLVFIQVVYVAMVYGPIAAYLVELFPTKIRYTSLSVPYHLGNGWFGGFTPFIASWLVASTGNIYMGLAYPIGVATMTVIVGGLLLKETRQISIYGSDAEPA